MFKGLIMHDGQAVIRVSKPGQPMVRQVWQIRKRTYVNLPGLNSEDGLMVHSSGTEIVSEIITMDPDWVPIEVRVQRPRGLGTILDQTAEKWIALVDQITLMGKAKNQHVRRYEGLSRMSNLVEQAKQTINDDKRNSLERAEVAQRKRRAMQTKEVVNA